MIVTMNQIDEECAKRFKGALKMALDIEMLNNPYLRRLAFRRSFVYPSAPWYTAIHPRIRSRWASRTLNAAMKEAGL